MGGLPVHPNDCSSAEGAWLKSLNLGWMVAPWKHWCTQIIFNKPLTLGCLAQGVAEHEGKLCKAVLEGLGSIYRGGYLERFPFSLSQSSERAKNLLLP